MSRRGGPSGLIAADFPDLRVKHLTGVAASGQGQSDLIAHGVDEASIVCWVATVERDAAFKVSEGHNTGSGLEFYVSVIPGGWLEVRNAPLNSSSIVNGAIRILLFYMG